MTALTEERLAPDSPRFSVVIPLYNMAPTISRAVGSALGQTCSDLEVIVVDDGSSDGGADLAERTGDPRLRVIRQANAGAAAARNTGIRAARARHVTFLDADDAYDPHFLATVRELIQRYPQAGLYVTSYRIAGARHQVAVAPSYPELPEAGPIPDFVDVVHRHLFLGLISSSCCLDRSVTAQTGCFQEGVHFAEDTHYWLHLALHYPVVFTREVAATVHSDTGKGGDLLSQRRCYASEADFRANHPCHVLLTDLQELDLPPLTQTRLRRLIAITFADIAVIHYYHGRDEIAEAVFPFAAAEGAPVTGDILREWTVAFCDQLVDNPPALRHMLATRHLARYPDLRLFYRFYLLVPSRRWLSLRHHLRRRLAGSRQQVAGGR